MTRVQSPLPEPKEKPWNNYVCGTCNSKARLKTIHTTSIFPEQENESHEKERRDHSGCRDNSSGGQPPGEADVDFVRMDALQETFEHGGIAEMFADEYERVVFRHKFLTVQIGEQLVFHMPVQLILDFRVEIVSHGDLLAQRPHPFLCFVIQ